MTKRALASLAALAVAAPIVAGCGDDDSGSPRASRSTPAGSTPSASSPSDSTSSTAASSKTTSSTASPSASASSGAGGGSASSSGDAATALAAAGQKTAAKGGAKISIKQDLKLGGRSISTGGEGEIDLKTGRGHLTIELGNLPGLSGGGDLTRQETVIDGTTIYLKSPLLARTIGNGKPWIKLDLAKVGAASGLSQSGLQGGQDLVQSLTRLKATTGGVQRVGSDTVRGEATTHYRTRIDLRKVPATVPAGQRAAVRRAMQQTIRTTGTSTIPVDVWLDGDGALRRLRQTVNVTKGGRIAQSYDVYDFGRTVKVQVPPASQTTDASSAFLGGGRGTHTLG